LLFALRYSIIALVAVVAGGVYMEQAMVNFRMDRKMKLDMEKICKKMGLSMTAAFTMFAAKVINEKRIPFEVSVDPFYSETNMKRLRKSIEQMEKTGGTIHKVNLDD
jgi:DNA-damage-inducible protein J